jgi:hypothetical protein
MIGMNHKVSKATNALITIGNITNVISKVGRCYFNVSCRLHLLQMTIIKQFLELML